jgi:hypothetical protein
MLQISKLGCSADVADAVVFNKHMANMNKNS